MPPRTQAAPSLAIPATRGRASACSRSRSRGISMLEASLVTLILTGILSTMMVSLRGAQSEAQLTVLKAVGGNMRAASDLFFLKCQAIKAQRTDDPCQHLEVSPAEVIVGVRQYPAASLDGIAQMVGIVNTQGISSRFEIRAISTNGVKGLSVSLLGVENNSCDLQYLEAADEGKRPSIILNPSTCH